MKKFIDPTNDIFLINVFQNIFLKIWDVTTQIQGDHFLDLSNRYFLQIIIDLFKQIILL